MRGIYPLQVPKVTAIIHTNNDALRIGRAVESLRVCDEVLVVDHQSTDDSAGVAREHGALVKIGVPGVEPGAYISDARHDWILCLLPNEALHENLETSLHEWKDSEPGDVPGFCIQVREETADGWRSLGLQLRLVNRLRMNWPDKLPPAMCEGQVDLDGEILRFSQP
jgi:glycosyltransferase involved in cell wall biosynthesis